MITMKLPNWHYRIMSIYARILPYTVFKMLCRKVSIETRLMILEINRIVSMIYVME